MSSIRLHPKKGLNPVLGVCPLCGNDNGEILLLGAVSTKYTCRSCGKVHIGRPKIGECVSCGSSGFDRQEISEFGEKIPTNYCKDCRKKLKQEQETFRREVEQGGAYFRCVKCGTRGVMKAGTEAARDYRKRALDSGLIKKENEPFGVELKGCPNCP